MSLATESVTLPGSGLVFVNYYQPNVTPAYRAAILTAENYLQSHFTNATTVGVSFDFASLGGTFSAQNTFDPTPVSYSAYVAALTSHAVTADDLLAVAGLPASDPSNGAGFNIAASEARILGLGVQTNSIDDHVTLNSDLSWTFGQDAVGAILHEITEGVFGRTSSLGIGESRWNPLDLFRFTAAGQRDFTGGSDGVSTFFGIDASHVSSLQYHSSISAAGVDDGFDLGDWDHIRGDSFGPGGPSSPGSVSATDLQVLDVLGWTPVGAGAPFVPPPDDFASSQSDVSLPFGALGPGGTVQGALQSAGDRDWFQVSFQPGVTYTITERGWHSGAGTLADPFLRLHDASGAVVASNDDIVSGSNPDSQIVFTAPSGGAYYVEAGGFVDGYTGTYRLSLSQSGGGGGSASTIPTIGADQITGSAGGGDTIDALAGDDTINAGGPASNYLRGNDGDDSIVGGSGFDDINGNKGNDTISGGASGDDWLVGGQGNDLITARGGNDLIYGNLGNDTLMGGTGNEIMRGGQGDDSLAGGSGNDFISGDRGNDTMSGGAGADIFHSSQDAGIDRVLDFHLSEGDRVQLDPGTTFGVSQVGADTVIDMGGGNQMILVGVQMSTLPPGTIFGA
jgi:Ca2+-binding RTX toxin-like protein